MADAAAQRQAADAGRRDDSRRHGEAVLMGGCIDFAELGTALDARHPR